MKMALGIDVGSARSVGGRCTIRFRWLEFVLVRSFAKKFESGSGCRALDSKCLMMSNFDLMHHSGKKILLDVESSILRTKIPREIMDWIDGFGLGNYRSFGDNIQLIGPFQKINLFAGKNNSGKSNALRFIEEHYQKCFTATKDKKLSFTSIDFHNRKDSLKIKVAYALNDYPGYLTGLKDSRNWRKDVFEALLSLKEASVFNRGTKAFWFEYEINNGVADFSKEFFLDIEKNKEIKIDWRALWNQLLSRTGGSKIDHWIPETIRHINPINQKAIKINGVSAFRRVGDPNSLITEDYNGPGLIERLARLQNPSFGQQDLKKDFKKINHFLQTVLGNRTAILEIPSEKDMILVNMDGKTLPLTSLGTGVHEIIILAAAATVLKDQVLCIEEPEIHLHPEMQRKLIRYLDRETNNQYFISTHSAHLLDAVTTASIFHFVYDNNLGQTTVRKIETDVEKFSICTDLGYKASDLLQANSIIWVEGPSDRIYLNHWIKAVDDKLVEGLHYSIMFYGGRLLRHLTANDPEIEDFISLRRLNRNIAVLIDSDKRAPRSKLNKTKARVIKEFASKNSYAWVTKGTEIENYISKETLRVALTEMYPNYRIIDSSNEFSDVLKLKDKKGELFEADKLKVAYAVSQSEAKLNVLDLNKKIRELIKFIYEANRDIQ